MTTLALPDVDEQIIAAAVDVLPTTTPADLIAALTEDLMGVDRHTLVAAYARLVVRVAAERRDDNGDEVERSGLCYKDDRLPAEPGQDVDFRVGHRWDGWWAARTAELRQVTP